ncbi:MULTISPECIES: RidA family protein [unclassified Micromonospora]|uniref:RidA family protein n=1 Tax=unclassified Micromonospora TaxID=2617518 RepID=UPI001033F71C|nr:MULTISPECIES: RidA family protein [unclassified Micromonospora]QKW15212.1 RidA family protein [Verrucosispora sp. NA02020]TBL31429.1 RidA family protein [Verrucosispora sp. SN26_14.1]
MSGTEDTSPERRLADLGITLPPARTASGAYDTVVVSGDLAVLSGHGPVRPGHPLPTGKLGAELSVPDGQAAVRQATLNLLATLRAAAGSLDDVEQLLTLTVAINATPAFTDHVPVADTASELLRDVFGDRGRHARSALGHSSLPFDVPVSLALTARIRGRNTQV